MVLLDRVSFAWLRCSQYDFLYQMANCNFASYPVNIHPMVQEARNRVPSMPTRYKDRYDDCYEETPSLSRALRREPQFGRAVCRSLFPPFCAYRHCQRKSGAENLTKIYQVRCTSKIRTVDISYRPHHYNRHLWWTSGNFLLTNSSSRIDSDLTFTSYRDYDPWHVEQR